MNKNININIKQTSMSVAKALLIAIGLAGGLALVLAVPNLASAFSPWVRSTRKFKDQQIKRSLYYLQSRKYIGMGKQGDKATLVLTEQGQKKLLTYQVEDMVLPKPKRWDGKFRMVLFDIPEKYKQNRDGFSSKLKSLGFMPIQKSVWLWPYECEQEILFLAELYEVSPFVKYALVTKVNLDQRVFKHFGI